MSLPINFSRAIRPYQRLYHHHHLPNSPSFHLWPNLKSRLLNWLVTECGSQLDTIMIDQQTQHQLHWFIFSRLPAWVCNNGELHFRSSCIIQLYYLNCWMWCWLGWKAATAVRVSRRKLKYICYLCNMTYLLTYVISIVATLFERKKMVELTNSIR